MRAKKIMWAAVVTALAGCGGTVASAPSASTTAPVIASAIAPAPQAETVSETVAIEATSPAIDPTTLPDAPWADAPLVAREVPAPIMGAWERAENREWCAPIAPTALGAAEGARARPTELAGGWQVEFDHRGMPGIGRDGSTCESCGRGVFGIAGTAMTPEELAGERGDSPSPSFRDGSHAQFEIDQEQHVAAASLTVAGQGCVYQVWSFLGEEHLAELVHGLRRVDLPAARSAGTVASAR